MINAAVLVDNFVALLRDIPEYVAAMGGNPAHIQPYHDHFPQRMMLGAAVEAMTCPSTLVVYDGFEPAGNDNQLWRHRLVIYVRPQEEPETPPRGFYQLLRLLVSGIPTSQGERLLHCIVHPDCLPMDLPTSRRGTGGEGDDFFEITLGFVEQGDE